MSFEDTVSRVIFLRGATVVDPRDGSLSPGSDIRIVDGRIESVSPSASSAPESDAHVVEANGKFVIPGLLDMHMHCLQDPHPGNSLALMLSYGITGVRQMAGSSALLRARREGLLDYGPNTPELLAMPGDVLTSANAATPSASIAEVRKQKEEGADFIKTIFVTPKVFAASLAEANKLGLPYGGHISPGVDMEQASNTGLRFVEHLGPVEVLLIKCSKLEVLLMLLLRLRPPAAMKLSMEGEMGEAMRYIIANPVLFRLKLDPGTLGKTQRLINSFSEDKANRVAETFVRNGTWQCPTLIRNTAMQFADQTEFTEAAALRYIPKSYRDLWLEASRQYRERLTPASRETLRQLKQVSFRLTRIQAEAGVKMTAGSDCGGGGSWVVPGVSLHQEFDLLERAGIAPLKVLQMATCNGAEFMNRLDSLGSVTKGKQADIVILNANPLESIQNLHGIAGVVRNGQYYSPEALHAMREQVADHVGAEEKR